MLHDEYLQFDVHFEGWGAKAGELGQRDSPVGLVGTCGWLPGRCEEDSEEQ